VIKLDPILRFHEEAWSNSTYEWFLRDTDLSLWNTPAVTVFDEDPRAPFVKCGEFVGLCAPPTPGR
jgi:hypothetical protein